MARKFLFIGPDSKLVPPHLFPVFRGSEKIQLTLLGIREYARKCNRFERDPIGYGTEVDWDLVRKHLRAAADEMMRGRPYEACPDCGKQQGVCQTCGGKRWLSLKRIKHEPPLWAKSSSQDERTTSPEESQSPKSPCSAKESDST